MQEIDLRPALLRDRSQERDRHLVRLLRAGIGAVAIGRIEFAMHGNGIQHQAAGAVEPGADEPVLRAELGLGKAGRHPVPDAAQPCGSSATAPLVVPGIAQDDDVAGANLVLDPLHRDQRVGPRIATQGMEMDGGLRESGLQQKAEGLLVVHAIAEHEGIAQGKDLPRGLGRGVSGESRAIAVDRHHGVEMLDCPAALAEITEDVASRVGPIALLGILGEEALRGAGHARVRLRE